VKLLPARRQEALAELGVALAKGHAQQQAAGQQEAPAQGQQAGQQASSAGRPSGVPAEPGDGGWRCCA
jgi:hypothetical protein